jgi:hypothetical protein
LKFAAVFVDQKDQRKPIVLVISNQNSQWKNESEGFLLLPSNFPGAPTRHAEVQT